MLERVVKFFTSLKLTFALLCLAMVLVFVGTLAQVNEGLYQAQARYFKSYFVWWAPPGASWKLPIFPGGYLVGTLLLVNLLAAHARRFKFTRRKIGILLIHAGLILLLVGQLLTDALSVESAMRLTEGSAKSYSEDFRANEVVLIDTSSSDSDQVISVPETLLARRREIRLPGSPFTLRVKNYWPNTDLLNSPVEGSVPSGATRGGGVGLHVLPKPRTTKSDERDLPTAVVEVATEKGALGTWLVSSQIGRLQTFTNDSKAYALAMRFTRHYKPYSIHLTDFRHDRYKGTDIPKNFSSRVRVQNPASGEDREVLIYMNNPLRYGGETYYQGSYDPNDARVSILQVVRNPGWLTPYFSCALVAAGLIVQFLTHLIDFVAKRRIA
jgi:hypothetical protein